jgi:hypothetical protein
MLQYKAGYKFVDGGVHAQVLDFPAAITCGDLVGAGAALAGAQPAVQRGGDGHRGTDLSPPGECGWRDEEVLVG